MKDPKQIAYEKHLEIFAMHIKHLEQLDGPLEAFARDHGFSTAKNDWHRPCRILRKGANPKYAIEILQEGEWSRIVFRDDLPHTLEVAGYFVDDKKEFLYQQSEQLAYFVHFSTIQSNLNDYLATALDRIEKWTAEVIQREGAKSEHPMAYYRKHGGIKIQ